MIKGQKHSKKSKKINSETNKERYRNGAITWNKKLRKEVICACGCGNKFINVSDDGRTRTFIKGHNKPWKGRNRSEETIKKIIASKKGIPLSIEQRLQRVKDAKRGEENNKWKGGVTPINEKIRKSFEYKLWRTSVFKRDNYTCKECGARNGNGKKIFLQADHIKQFAFYPELRFDINNGRTLCLNCHRKTKTWGYNPIKKLKTA